MPGTMRVHTTATTKSISTLRPTGCHKAEKPACACTMIKGVAPAGGCMVLVASMKISVRTHASTCTGIEVPNACVHRMPISAPPRCPPNKARGCAAAALVRPNRKIVEPPIDAKKIGDMSGYTTHSAVLSAIAAPMTHDDMRNICVGYFFMD